MTMSSQHVETTKLKRALKQSNNALLDEAQADLRLLKSKIIDTIVEVGGLNCVTIISQDIHNLNPDFCQTFLGFQNFQEAKVYINAHFQV